MNRFLGCGLFELGKPQWGCLDGLEAHADEWEANRAFLTQPPADWYRLIKELRALR